MLIVFVRSSIDQLAAAIEALEQRSAGVASREDAVAVGCPEVDRVLSGGLRRAAVHEWFAQVPPISLFMHLAGQSWHKPTASSDASMDLSSSARSIIWIGRSCWPHPVVLGSDQALLRASILVDPPDSASRLWALDLALRSPAVAMVIGDGSGLSIAQRRVEAGSGA